MKLNFAPAHGPQGIERDSEGIFFTFNTYQATFIMRIMLQLQEMELVFGHTHKRTDWQTDVDYRQSSTC